MSVLKKHLPKILNVVSMVAPKIAARYALKLFATPIRTPRPESEMEMFGTSKKYFLNNGIAAFEWGNPTHPLVMLIHGWNGRGTQISAFAKSLVANNFRVVALDGPGHGASSSKMTNPAHYAQFIIDAQKELNQNGAIAVIAHSFGGGCSVLAAKRGLKVQKLVLIASPAFYDRVVTYFAVSFGLNKKAENEFFKMVTEVSGFHPAELNTGLIGASLNISALIVHDEVDSAVNFLSAQAIHEAWPGSLLLKTQGLGHRRILKDSHVIAQVTDFIAKK